MHSLWMSPFGYRINRAQGGPTFPSQFYLEQIYGRKNLYNIPIFEKPGGIDHFALADYQDKHNFNTLLTWHNDTLNIYTYPRYISIESTGYTYLDGQQIKNFTNYGAELGTVIGFGRYRRRVNTNEFRSNIEFIFRKHQFPQ